ncbi:hypothetical protein CQA40_09630 [Helicobacter sp. MIT 01-3238]|nr:hypothetical protein CQA40_09630 [Helicobacter sp. MIT 01-3238]
MPRFCYAKSRNDGKEPTPKPPPQREGALKSVKNSLSYLNKSEISKKALLVNLHFFEILRFVPNSV